MRHLPPERVVERVLSRWVADESGCWISSYSVGSHGYAQVGWHEAGRIRMTLVHRVAWFAFNGPIPDGLTVDHMCHTRRCVNPTHLRLLTNVENARDNGFATRTHCPAGHPYDEENTYVRPSGERNCRACARTYRRKAAA